MATSASASSSDSSLWWSISEIDRAVDLPIGDAYVEFKARADAEKPQLLFSDFNPTICFT
ncbi:unnamed protein product [Arabidopsis halleri]